MPAKKPLNILFIFSDQHRRDAINAHNPDLGIKTPNLDKLIDEGSDFERAYCPIPMCVPTRNALLCGRWPSQSGVVHNFDGESWHPLPAGQKTFVSSLKAAQYQLGHVGRWHVDPERSPLDFGFDDYICEWDYFGWRKDSGIPAPPRENKWFGETDHYILPEQSCIAWTADKIMELLQKYQQEGRPFLLRWQTMAPHLPNRVPEPYASLYDPEKIEPWPGFADDLTLKPEVQRQMRKTWGLEDWTWKDWAPVVARYFGEISLLDAQIGRVLDYLDRLGLAENTLVIYSSDHGDMCGSHGMIDKHCVMYEDILRVPLMMRLPGIIEAGSKNRDWVINSIDFASTFCAAAGQNAPPEFMGLDLLAMLSGELQNPRKSAFSSYYGNQFGNYSSRALITENWKYIWNPVSFDELYDLQNDPGELHNLAAKDNQQKRLQELREQLITWMEKTDDKLLNQWTRNQLEHGQRVKMPLS